MAKENAYRDDGESATHTHRGNYGAGEPLIVVDKWWQHGFGKKGHSLLNHYAKQTNRTFTESVLVVVQLLVHRSKL